MKVLMITLAFVAAANADVSHIVQPSREYLPSVSRQYLPVKPVFNYRQASRVVSSTPAPLIEEEVAVVNPAPVAFQTVTPIAPVSTVRAFEEVAAVTPVPLAFNRQYLPPLARHSVTPTPAVTILNEPFAENLISVTPAPTAAFSVTAAPTVAIQPDVEAFAVTPAPIVKEYVQPAVAVTPAPLLRNEFAAVSVTPAPLLQQEFLQLAVSVTPAALLRQEFVQPAVAATPAPFLQQNFVQESVAVTPAPLLQQEFSAVSVTPAPLLRQEFVQPAVAVTPAPLLHQELVHDSVAVTPAPYVQPAVEALAVTPAPAVSFGVHAAPLLRQEFAVTPAPALAQEYLPPVVAAPTQITIHSPSEVQIATPAPFFASTTTLAPTTFFAQQSTPAPFLAHPTPFALLSHPTPFPAFRQHVAGFQAVPIEIPIPAQRFFDHPVPVQTVTPGTIFQEDGYHYKQPLVPFDFSPLKKK